MSAVKDDLRKIIQDAIYDARNAGQTIGVAAEKASEAVLAHVADELTRSKYGDVFRAAWLKADAEGRDGERVEAGLSAIAEAVKA